MSDEEALLAAVLAHPEDDLPRLVFADWLEETGQPANAARAHFIRLQIEAARRETGSREALNLLREADGHRMLFVDEVDETIGDHELQFDQILYRRGFLDTVRGQPETLFPNAGVLVHVAPLRQIEFALGTDLRELLSQCPWLSELSAMRVLQSDRHSLERINAILQCEHLISLTSLKLTALDLTDAWILWFVSRFHLSPLVRSLRVLDLAGNRRITDAGAAALAAARGMDQLSLLRLPYCGISANGVNLLRNRFGDRVEL